MTGERVDCEFVKDNHYAAEGFRSHFFIAFS